MSEHDGRVWFITGSTSGFGRAFVDAARARGERVVATGRRRDALAELEGEGVLTLELDVTRAEAIEPALTMFFGAAALTRAVVPRMRARGSGTIVQITSQGGRMAGPGISAYCAAKFALEGLSESVAAEVAPFGVRVLIVEPGSFRTGLLGPSMHAAGAMDEYASTVGGTRSFFAGEDGRQPGDPTKAVAAVMTALDADDPPLRLVLGAAAVEGLRGKYEELLAELARWEELSRSTAFDA